jgi:hypothetical protein
MKKQHYRKFKFHTIFSIILSTTFLIVLLFVRDLSFGIAVIFLCAYVIGNGIIHVKNNELSRDTIIEYIIVSMIAAIVIIGSFSFFEF